MSEDFENIVNAPHRALGRATKRILSLHPDKWYGKAAKGAGVTMTGLMQFLTWAVKYLALDNHALRAGENALREMKVGKNKYKQDKKLSAFMKKKSKFVGAYYLLHDDCIDYRWGKRGDRTGRFSGTGKNRT